MRFVNIKFLLNNQSMNWSLIYFHNKTAEPTIWRSIEIIWIVSFFDKTGSTLSLSLSLSLSLFSETQIDKVSIIWEEKPKTFLVNIWLVQIIRFIVMRKTKSVADHWSSLCWFSLSPSNETSEKVFRQTEFQSCYK